jgi:Ulp1 protease family, C-terminal catalytic domain
MLNQYTFIRFILLPYSDTKEEEPDSKTPPQKAVKSPQPHVTYVGVSRAKTEEPNSETGFESLILMHPLVPEDFAIPEIRKQLIHGEYKRLRALEEAAPLQTSEGPLVSAFINDSTRKGKSPPLFSHTDSEEAVIRRSFRKCDDEDIVAENFGIPINRAMLRCLDERAWIEDRIINYIFSIWNQRATDNNSRHLFVCTFFMDRLQKDNYTFADVRDWFNLGVDIKDDSILYIPVNIGNTHWTLLVINMLDKTIKYYDGLRGTHHLRMTYQMCTLNSIFYCCRCKKWCKVFETWPPMGARLRQLLSWIQDSC